MFILFLVMLARARINQNLLVKFLSVELGGEAKAASKGMRAKETLGGFWEGTAQSHWAEVEPAGVSSRVSFKHPLHSFPPSLSFSDVMPLLSLH